MKAYLNFGIRERSGIYTTGCFGMSAAPVSSEIEISLPKGFVSGVYNFGIWGPDIGIKYPDGTIVLASDVLYTIHTRDKSIPAIPLVPDAWEPRAYPPIRLKYKVTRL